MRTRAYTTNLRAATRMLNNSKPGKIRISDTSADLLGQEGFDSWLLPDVCRTDWWVTDERLDDVLSCVSNSSVSGDTNSDDGEEEDELRVSKLVAWNVEILIGFIKNIVFSRHLEMGYTEKPSDRPGFELEKGRTFLDEVREVIDLPNKKGTTNDQSENDEEIPSEVRAELKELVREIAMLYENNPFHNFRHAW